MPQYPYTERNEGSATMIKFNKYNVVNTETKVKARVRYSYSKPSERVDGRECVTIYHKDYSSALAEVFSGEVAYKNDTDSRTDYFDKGRVNIFAGDKMFKEALDRC
jgi:hypothetical protein